MPPIVTLIGIEGMPDIKRGDDIARLTVDAARRQGTPLTDGDIVVVTQKIVSKAEGRGVKLTDVQPSPLAEEFARLWQKDARVVEMVFRESRRIIRMDFGVLITETRHGWRCANAGIDASNIGPGSDDVVMLLPEDPDASCRRIRDGIKALEGIGVAVLMSDTFGRPWREGAENVAIGAAGIDPLWDYRGMKDTYGRELQSTVIAIGDELAAAAELVTNKLTRVPVAIVRGYPFKAGDSGAKALIREPSKDMFRY